MTTSRMNPVLLSEVRQYLAETAAAMESALRQAVVSTAVVRQGATAAGFHSASGALVVGGRASHPLLLESCADAVASWGAGDAAGADGEAVFGTNDPRRTGAGLEDLVLLAPIVRDDAVCGAVTLVAGHPALGRATLAPVGRLRREGLVLPWTRLGRRAALDEQIGGLLAANAAEPEEFRADLTVHLHCLDVGRAAVERLLDRLGPGLLAEAWAALGAAAESPLASLIAALRGATVRGAVPPFRAHVSPAEDGVVVRIEDASCTVPPGLARAAVRAAFRQMLAVEHPALGTQGDLQRLVRVEAAEAAPDTPVGEARFAGAQGVAAATMAALAETIPHLTHAPDGGCLLLDLRGEANGRRYRVRLGLPGGSGASVYGDGLTHAGPAFSPYRTPSVEEIERAFPLRVVRLELVEDSGGPGQYRGGLGSLFELELLAGRAQVDVLLPGAAHGMRGGMRGGAGRLVHISPEDGQRETRGLGLVTVDLRAGHRLVLESPGGAGWGIPFQRSIMRLEEDLGRGLVTPTQSRNRYGVVLKPGTLEKDDHLTYRVRHYLLSTLAVEDIIAGEELLD